MEAVNGKWRISVVSASYTRASRQQQHREPQHQKSQSSTPKQHGLSGAFRLFMTQLPPPPASLYQASNVILVIHTEGPVYVRSQDVSCSLNYICQYRSHLTVETLPRLPHSNGGGVRSSPAPQPRPQPKTPFPHTFLAELRRYESRRHSVPPTGQPVAERQGEGRRCP